MDLPSNLIRTADSNPTHWQSDTPPVDGFGSQSLSLSALGLDAIGAHLEILRPGLCACPLHHHRFEEEHFYVLSGTLTARELDPATNRYREHEVGAGELVAYLAGTGLGHQFINRGSDEARFLAISDRRRGDICVYPESGKILLRGLPDVGVFHGRSPGSPPQGSVDAEAQVTIARSEAALRPGMEINEGTRPGHIVGPSRLEERVLGQGDHRFFGLALAREAGARSMFVNRDRLPSGSRASDLHWHTANEELLLVLQGRPTLRQRRGHRDADGRPVFDNAPETQTPLQPGDLIHWSPGDLVAHQVINFADSDAVLLVVGNELEEDICALPERDALFVSALDQIGPLSSLDYWAGEVPPGSS